jgi:hypothetical protein
LAAFVDSLTFTTLDLKTKKIDLKPLCGHVALQNLCLNAVHIEHLEGEIETGRKPSLVGFWCAAFFVNRTANLETSRDNIDVGVDSNAYFRRRVIILIDGVLSDEIKLVVREVVVPTHLIINVDDQSLMRPPPAFLFEFE